MTNVKKYMEKKNQKKKWQNFLAIWQNRFCQIAKKNSNIVGSTRLPKKDSKIVEVDLPVYGGRSLQKKKPFSSFLIRFI